MTFRIHAQVLDPNPGASWHLTGRYNRPFEWPDRETAQRFFADLLTRQAAVPGGRILDARTPGRAVLEFPGPVQMLLQIVAAADVVPPSETEDP